MNANDVLIDLIEDNRRRLGRVFPKIDDDCLYWQPDPGANSIAVTTWHMGRLFDVFLAQLARGEPPENEIWIRGGWAQRCGYDPRGLGRDGWGSLNDYTIEQMRAIPRFSRQQLLGYYDQVLNEARAYLQVTPIEELLAPAPGFEGRFSKYQIIQMALMDNTRHLGEIFTLKNMWERRQV
ncbi:MAG: DinB family protein [Anaerolineales bacterium]|nr:DinB family protein [Anaerolineales bacterium]